MAKGYLRRLGYLGAFGALLAATLPYVLAASPAHASLSTASEGLRIVVQITDTGYQCVEGCDAVSFERDQWNLGIEAAGGQLVELVFVWAHGSEYSAEEHIMVVEGYDLRSERIDLRNRETTLRFIADEPGDFTLKCDIECDLHDYMQRGFVRVTRAGPADPAGTAPLYTPTSLKLQSSTHRVVGGQSIDLRAALTDPDGAPVPGALIGFYTIRRLGPAEGSMLLGRGRTDADGVVVVEYRPTLPVGEYPIVVRFGGMGVYDATEEVLWLEIVGESSSAYTPEPIGLDEIRGWAPAALVLIMATVWVTLGLVLFKLLTMPRRPTAS